MRPRSSLNTGPFDSSADVPPSRQASRQRVTDRSCTRNRAAMVLVDSPASNTRLPAAAHAPAVPAQRACIRLFACTACSGRTAPNAIRHETRTLRIQPV
jgi:hypothetical protein